MQTDHALWRSHLAGSISRRCSPSATNTSIMNTPVPTNADRPLGANALEAGTFDPGLGPLDIATVTVMTDTSLRRNKVAIVGAGSVGATLAYAA